MAAAAGNSAPVVVDLLRGACDLLAGQVYQMFFCRLWVTLCALSPRCAVSGHFRCVYACKPDAGSGAVEGVAINDARRRACYLRGGRGVILAGERQQHRCGY